MALKHHSLRATNKALKLKKKKHQQPTFNSPVGVLILLLGIGVSVLNLVKIALELIILLKNKKLKLH